MIIAIDFLNTIAKVDSVTKKLVVLPNAKNVINLLHSKGNYIIIFTTTPEDQLLDLTNYLNENDIHFDSINKNKPNLKYKTSSKIFADVYIDDKSIFCNSIIWKNIPNLLISYINNHAKKRTN